MKYVKAINITTIKSNETTYVIREDLVHKNIDDIFKEYKIKHANDTIKEYSEDIGNNITLKGVILINSTNNKTIHSNYYFMKYGYIYHIYENGTGNVQIVKEIANSLEKNIT